MAFICQGDPERGVDALEPEELAEPVPWFKTVEQKVFEWDGADRGPHEIHEMYFPEPPIAVWWRCAPQWHEKVVCGDIAATFYETGAEKNEGRLAKGLPAKRRFIKMPSLDDAAAIWQEDPEAFVAVAICEFDDATEPLTWYHGLPDDRRRRVRVYVIAYPPMLRGEERQFIPPRQVEDTVFDQAKAMGFKPHYLRAPWRLIHRPRTGYHLMGESLDVQVQLRWGRLVAEDRGFIGLVGLSPGGADDLYHVDEEE